ncbi:hypothetical protein [Pseudotenacibaculum haliotis]|uniref:Secreted protein n=1 Tax=Pseudotenacibaculum haliotis TaxID=1862138 RepID=A0ABW5LT87_9FLAO
MKAQKLLPSLLVIILPFYLTAQEFYQGEAIGSNNLRALSSFNQITIRNSALFENVRDGQNSVNGKFYESITGDSPYINNAFFPAKVNNYKEFTTARYDAFKDLIVVKINDSKGLYLEKRLGNKVRFMTTNEVYQVFYDEEEKAGFFKVLETTSKYAMLIKQQVQLKGGEKPRNSYDKYVDPFFKRVKDKLYISLDNKNAVKAPTSKKKFFKLFTDDANAIRSFVNKNKLNIKSQKDILKILNYYATL